MGIFYPQDKTALIRIKKKTKSNLEIIKHKNRFKTMDSVISKLLRDTGQAYEPKKKSNILKKKKSRDLFDTSGLSF